MPRPNKVFPGMRFGRLLVTSVTIGSPTVCETLCDCGNTKKTRSMYLVVGQTKSCGCLIADKVFRTHGHSIARQRTPTYTTWQSMKRRCLDPRRDNYKHYGARGIRVCERWNDFNNFLADMGERPEDKTLDRIDVNGHYEPTNCRWATGAEQAANKR